MNRPVPLVAIFSSLAIHALLIAWATNDWLSHPASSAEPTPILVQLAQLPPEKAANALPHPPTPGKKIAPKPAPAPTALPPAGIEQKAEAPIETPEPPRERLTSTDIAVSAPPAPTPLPAAPIAAAPYRTSVSIANYAAGNPKPHFPTLSRTYGEQGTVILRVLVKADGSAGQVEIKTSSGFPLLDEAARSAVQRWRFVAATVDGKAVPEWYQVPIPFTLQK